MKKFIKMIFMSFLLLLLFQNNVYAKETNKTIAENKATTKCFAKDYNGSPYKEINNNTPFFTKSEKNNYQSFEKYSKLDSFGRCGVAYANLHRSIMPTEERGEIGMIKPSGWHTIKYPNLINGNYLYNRCHLIAFCLAGENANECNLITGTRYLNVEGMLPFEEKVADYLRKSNNHVLYRVTPIFNGSNLVAEGVLMEAYSVEDKGAGIQFCVFIYNVQPNIEIDYATGNSKEVTLVNSSIKTSKKEKVQKYILNTNTKKIHLTTCKSIKNISKKNKKESSLSKDELLKQGYSTCGICKP